MSAECTECSSDLYYNDDGVYCPLCKLLEYENKVEILEQAIQKLKNNSNCKYGGGNRCNYPNAYYTNCFTFCNEWELGNCFSSEENKKLKLK